MRNTVAAIVMFLSIPLIHCENLIYDRFESGRIDTAIWQVTIDGDFESVAVDVVDIDPSDSVDYRLRFQANTLYTSTPMKYLGVRATEAIDLSNPKVITCEIDWNDQANGSYLTASIYVCPTTSENPREEPDWVAIEYTGVPPGRNLRTSVRLKTGGSLRNLYEDWGPRDGNNRPLGKPVGNKTHTVRLIISQESIQVLEDGVEIVPSTGYHFDFDQAFVYLQMSSGTNYPSREIYFDNFLVTQGTD